MSDEQRTPVKAGDRFGSLTAIKPVGRSMDKHVIWECLCLCGNTCVRATNSLRASSTIASCGCMNGRAHSIHGKRNSPEYSSWRAAKYRCHNSKSKDFPRYGGVGITMCNEWRASFVTFYAHMGTRPEGTSLDRIDPNRGYEPGNCRWATVDQQAQNKKKQPITVIINGKRITAKEFALMHGISHAAAINRIRRGRLYV